MNMDFLIIHNFFTMIADIDKKENQSNIKNKKKSYIQNIFDYQEKRMKQES